MSKNYGSWSLADLKSELRKRNAKLTGKKAVLIQRLQDYDKMFGGIINDPETAYKIKVPEPQHFLDISSDTNLPNITKTDLDCYSTLAEREDLETSEKMYQELYLLSCRVAKDTDAELFYVSAMCSSEMRKNVTYNIIVKITDNVIIEGQCECAAGMGPFAQCKHIVTLIYGLIDFTNNKNIKLKQSCTAELQTFHRPSKLYTGHPVKAEELNLKLLDGKMLTEFDPQPTSTLTNEKFQENFCNLVINFSSYYQSDMPIAQLVKPADKKVVFQDHDYLEKNQEDLYLESEYLNKNQRLDLEKQTCLNKKKWKKNRVMRLHSSDFGRICKCTDSNKKKLAKSLSQMTTINAPAIKHGIKYEKKAIILFSEITGSEVIKTGIIIHDESQFLGCTPDGLIGNDAVLEVKCPFTAKNKIITPESVPFIYLCEKTGSYRLYENHNYYYQVQGQLLCTKRNIAYFFIYTISDSYIIKIKRNEEFISNILSQLKLFYNDYFKNVILNKYLYK